MSQSQISMRYARALFALAKESSNVDEVYASMQAIGSLLQEVPTFNEFTHNPILSAQEREKVLKALFAGKVPSLVERFLLFISQRSRLNVLAGMVEAFDELYLGSMNRLRANVQTALPMEPVQKDRMTQQLGRKYSKEIAAQWQIRKDILGGFRILIAGKLHDYSFVSQLEEYKQKVLEA